MRVLTLSSRTVASLFVLFAAACGGAVETDETRSESDGQASSPTSAPHVLDELLVQWKPGATEAGKAQARARVNATAAETIQTDPMIAAGLGALEVLKLPSNVTVDDATAGLAGDPNIEIAEPNFVYQRQVVSNDALFKNGTLWGLRSTGEGFGMRAESAWARGNTGSSTVYIGIIDEGYMLTHEDLASNAGTIQGELPNSKRDEDGNGYIDDVNGWDFVSNDKTVFDGIEDDHGTHVAGIIGGRGGNTKGIAGVVWNVKLLSAKFLGPSGGTTSGAVKAIDYFTDMKRRRGLNIVATNNSWGGAGYSVALRAAIERANAQNILFVAAAGNSATNIDATAAYPAAYTTANVISVGALDSRGQVAWFSNWGKVGVDIFAPGVGIWSAVPLMSGKTVVSGYGGMSGTSMAAPYVTGAAALYASAFPGSTAAQIKRAILASATPTASLSGKCVTGGRLNVSTFFAPPPPPPLQ